MKLAAQLAIIQACCSAKVVTADRSAIRIVVRCQHTSLMSPAKGTYVVFVMLCLWYSCSALVTRHAVVNQSCGAFASFTVIDRIAFPKTIGMMHTWVHNTIVANRTGSSYVPVLGNMMIDAALTTEAVLLQQQQR